MSPRLLPTVFVDHRFPDAYRDLVDGRAVLVGLGSDEGLDTADALLVGATRRWDATAFAHAPMAKVISRVGVDYDNVDVDAAVRAGITVCNTPFGPTVSTAETTMALLLATTKQLMREAGRAREGLKAEPVGRAMELDGRTLGLVGFGRIASRVAVAAQALGMRVLATDPLVTEPGVAGVTMVDFEELLASSDVVSIHAPTIPSTHHLFDDSAFERMKSGSYLVNCARGSLVDHDALIATLNSGHLSGAGLDVTEPEPLPAGHPLLRRHDVIVTPHVASSTVAGRRRLYEHSIANALAVLSGRPADVVAAPGQPTTHKDVQP